MFNFVVLFIILCVPPSPEHYLRSGSCLNLTCQFWSCFLLGSTWSLILLAADPGADRDGEQVPCMVSVDENRNVPRASPPQLPACTWMPHSGRSFSSSLVPHPHWKWSLWSPIWISPSNCHLLVLLSQGPKASLQHFSEAPGVHSEPPECTAQRHCCWIENHQGMAWPMILCWGRETVPWSISQQGNSSPL